jgi:hypothetical protein
MLQSIGMEEFEVGIDKIGLGYKEATCVLLCVLLCVVVFDSMPELARQTQVSVFCDRQTTITLGSTHPTTQVETYQSIPISPNPKFLHSYQLQNV